MGPENLGETVVSDEDLEELDTSAVNELQQRGMLVEALLWEPSQGGRARCNICLRRCNIADGKAGYCRTKVNIHGTVYDTIYGVVSSAANDPVEKKPVFHYRPGSMVYSIGSLGCNFRCVFCQNWEIAYADGVASGGLCEPNLPPEKAIQVAKESGSQGIAWTYNEPAIWLNYALDCAKLAKQAGLYTVYVTNGYATPEGLDAIGPYLDVYRVDIKSMSDDFYRKLIKVPRVGDLLEVAKRAKDKWHMHVEAVTNIVPTWNDDEENLTKLATWIRDNLGELTPWHVTRFFPYAQLTNVPPTPPETLQKARDIGLKVGLKFVYLGNIALPGGENTTCPVGGEVLVERHGYRTRVKGVTPEGRCRQHGADLNMVM